MLGVAAIGVGVVLVVAALVLLLSGRGRQTRYLMRKYPTTGLLEAWAWAGRRR